MYLQGEYQVTIGKLDEILKTEEIPQETRIKVKLLYSLIKWRIGLVKVSAEYAQEALDESLEVNNSSFIVISIAMLAINNSWGGYADVIEYIPKAELHLDLLEKLDPKNKIFLESKAVYLLMKGNLTNFTPHLINAKKSDCIELFKKSLDLFQSLNNKMGEIWCYWSLGVYYMNLLEQKNSIDAYWQSLEIAEKINNKFWIGLNYNNIGLLFQDMKDHTSAESYFKQSLEIFQTIGVKSMISHAKIRLGIININNEKFLEAESYLKKGLSIYKESEETFQNLLLFLTGIGYCYFEKHQYNKALEYFSMLVLEASKLDKKDSVFDGMMGKVYIIREQGDIFKALNYAQEAFEFTQVHKQSDE